MNDGRSRLELGHWERGLAAFLQRQEKLEAVRFDPRRRSIEVATLGEVDLDLLQTRLSETIRLIEEERIDGVERGGGPGIADSISVRRGDAGETRLEKPTCPTAPLLWRWRELDWPEEGAEETGEEWRLLSVLAAICAAFGLCAWMLDTFAAVPAWVAIALYVCSMVAGGWDAAADAWEGIREGELDIHFLMLAVAVGASCIGAWAEGALLLFLFSFSGALEHFALFRTRREIDSLFRAAPKTATLIEESGEEREVPVSVVRVGDLLLTRPGEQFPVDGEVEEGKTAADESNLTGEANPVSKLVGDEVFGGTLNLWGTARVRATRVAGESAFQKVVRMIREAQHLKAPSQRFTDRFGTPYTLGILGLTAAMFFVWWLVFRVPAFANTEETRSAFYRAMTLLVVASPCALVLSIPSAILAAIAWGARNGILFRGGAAIEKLSQVDLVALDKTGTLTTGEMKVERVESFPPGRERDAAELAFSLESHGSHPIGRAIKRYGKEQGLSVRPISDFQAMSGRGIQGRAGESLCVLGRRELLESGPLAEWIKEVPEPPPEYVENWIVQESLIARILLRDQIREESKPILQRLKELGLRSVMLTGDRRGTAEAVGQELGIDEVRAGLRPEDKVAAIRGFAAEGRKVAMVGDGVNDAPSLAAAFVSVAMGARGSDAALEQSEVVLMNDRIDNFLTATALSNRARSIIRQNLAISLGTVLLMALAAVFGAIPLTVGVFAHEGSTVVVCLNSLRLLFGKS